MNRAKSSVETLPSFLDCKGGWWLVVGSCIFKLQDSVSVALVELTHLAMIHIWLTPQGWHQSCKSECTIFLQMSCTLSKSGLVWQRGRLRISLSNTFILDQVKVGYTIRLEKDYVQWFNQHLYFISYISKEIQVDYKGNTYYPWSKEVTKISSSFSLVNGYQLFQQCLFKEAAFQRRPEQRLSDISSNICPHIYTI